MEKQTLVAGAKRIIRELNRHGYTGYMVGGYVRDVLLHRTIKDIDIATSATPDRVMALFPHTAATGLKHGTVTVIADGHAYEVTTFRAENGYSDSRRPDAVTFITDLTEDLSRRDFTINAMAMDADGALFDPFHGQRDLQSAMLRCVGDPERRFAEDALRMLRCIRFAAEYSLTIDDATWRALLKCRVKLRHIAMERVRMELERIVEGSFPARGIDLLQASGLLDYTRTALPVTFSRNAEEEREPLLALIPSLAAPAQKWAWLLLSFAVNPEKAKRLFAALKFAKRAESEAVGLIALHEWIASELLQAEKHLTQTGQAAKVSVVQTVWRAGYVRFSRRNMAAWLDMMNLAYSAGGKLPGNLPPSLFAIMRECAQLWQKRLSLDSPEGLCVDGNDLLKAVGKPPGPWLGRVLRQLYEEVVYERIVNEREQLLERAMELMRNEAEK